MAVGYNPREKTRIIKQQGFNDENPIIDTELFSKILTEIIERYIGNKFKVRLIDTNFSFLPKLFPKENSDIVLMKAYLDKISWQKEKYFGEFDINNINEFLRLFLHYSLKYNYQDILLFSVEKDYVIQISHHGEMWITSTSKDLLKQIADKLDKKGATVIYSNN